MMTWMNHMFMHPSSYMMESIILMNDYVMMFLLSFISVTFLVLSFSTLSNLINLNFYENQEMESVWTIVPFLSLCFIAIPSLKTLYYLESCLFCGMSITIMGHQWYWSYHYKNFGMNMINSFLYSSPDTLLYSMECNNSLIIPVHTPIRALVSSKDVLHSWSLPSMGIKMDAVPGRINQICFSSYRTGVFYGLCSEICGAYHSFMPISVECVEMKDFINSF